MTISLPCYASREDVKAALESKETARNNARIDEHLQAASREAESLCHRRFYPEVATRYFDWPNYQYARSWRLWLDEDELISVSSLLAGGTTIASTDYFLEPVNSGPPYTHIEIDLDSSAAFESGSTHQRAIAVAGTYAGAPLRTTPGGALAEALDTSETAVDVTDSASIGIGSLINVESERMLVTGKSQLTTGQTVITTALTASAANESVLVTSAAGFTVGEVLTVDAERMLLLDITSNTLTVKRAWDGSTLAAHNTGVTIYAPRTLTVVRGALGTTAAAHDTATAITVQVYPSLVRELTIGETVELLSGHARAWAQSVSNGEGKTLPPGVGLPGLRDRVRQAHGRRRTVAI